MTHLQNKEKINTLINFTPHKQFIYKDEVGQGGLGRAILLYDETIDENFVCKKYSPIVDSIDVKKEYFGYFVREIKTLYKLYHENIVRVFNYYLYPESYTGYILMEYIDGENIAEYLKENPDKFDNIFSQVINGFRYLEQNKVLHRDIRPENILVTNNGKVKIIDFGFGKTSDVSNQENKSISLNWRYEQPNEFSSNIYDHKTDLYFVGKLFQEIINSINDFNSKYDKIIGQMIISYEKRFESFNEIYVKVNQDSYLEIETFTDSEIEIYQEFIQNLEYIIDNVEKNISYNLSTNDIISRLQMLYTGCMLETYIHNNSELISIFLKGNYSYFDLSDRGFYVSNLKAFYILLRRSSEDKRRILMVHLWARFNAIPRSTPPPNLFEEDEDLPF